MMAKIIADLAVITMLAYGYFWWQANLPILEKVVTWQQVVALSQTFLIVQVAVVTIGYCLIRWIHKDK